MEQVSVIFLSTITQISATFCDFVLPNPIFHVAASDARVLRMKKLFVNIMRNGLRRFFNFRRLIEISSMLNFPVAPPLTAEVKVTHKCDLKCKYCDVWRSQDKTIDLSTEQLTEIFASLKTLGVRIVTITGGESLLHPDLEKIVTIARRYHLRIHIITKCALLTNDKAVKLIEARANCIILSLDTLDPETCENLTGTSFNFAEKALKSLLYVKEKYQDIDVAVNCVINRYNIGEIAYFVKKITDYDKGKILINFQSYQRIPSCASAKW